MRSANVERDEQVLQLSLQGWSSREIARHLNVARKTVEAARARKGFVCTPELRRAALERGIARAKALGITGKHKNATCAAWSAEHNARRTAMIRAKCAEPEYRARLIAKLHAARAAVSEAEVGRRISAAKLAWCPEHLRAEHRILTRNKRMPAAEARAIILDTWALQLRNALRQIATVVPMAMKAAQEAADAATKQARLQAEADRAYRRSFAGQMERVKAGAALMPAMRLSRPMAFERSLTGNAEAMG